MRLSVSAEPQKEPILLGDLKQHLRILYTDEDTYLDNLIKLARTMVEDMTQRALITQTLVLKGECFPDYRIIELERAPVSAVTHLKYLDPDDVLQTLSSSKYTLSSGSPARLVLNPGESWPSLSELPDSVQITYVAGYGAEPDDVPEPLRHAVRFLAAHFFAIREPIVTGITASEIPLGIQALIMPYRVYKRC